MTARDRTGAAALMGAADHRPDRLRPVPRRRPAAVGQRPLQGRRRLPVDRQPALRLAASTRSRRRTSRSAPARPASCSRPTATARSASRRWPRAASRCSSASPAPRDVDAYLRGSSHSEVSDIDYAPVQRPLRRSSTAPASPARPPQQRIWAATGEHALHWDVESGDWSVVVMNADGSRGVAAAVSAGAKVPYIAEIAYGTLGVGLLFVIATAALTAYGTRPVARRSPSPSSAPARRRPPATRRARPGGRRSPAGAARTPAARRTGRPPAAGPETPKRPSSSSDQRARLVAPRAQLLDHLVAGELLRALRIAVAPAARAGSR